MSEATRVIHVRPADSGTGLPDLPASVVTVHSPAALVSVLSEQEPAVVVCEYALDGRETGLDVLARVRDTHPEIPVVLCTDEPDGEVASAATRLGVTEYVPRGSDEIALADRLQPYLTDQGTPVSDGNPGTQAAGGMPGDPSIETPGGREQELERVNRRLDLALDSMNAGVFVWEAGADQILWDEGTSELFGLAPRRRTRAVEDLVESIHPDDRERVMTDAEAAFEDGEHDPIEYRIELPDGETRWVQTHAEAVTDEAGRVDRLVGVTRDVTERRSMADELRESQNALHSLYEITSSRELDFETKLHRLLELGCERLDLDLGYLASVDGEAFEIEAVVGDESLAGHQAPLSDTYCQRTVESASLVDIRDTTSGEWADSTPTREYGFGCYLGGCVEVDGNLYGTLSFVDERARDRAFSETETTFVELVIEWLSFELERQQREQELRNARQRAENILERIDDGFFAVDDGWEITYFNSRAEGILGLSAADVVGEPLWDCLPDPIEQAVAEEYHEAMASQEPRSFEEYLPSLDSWVAVSAYPSQDGLSVYIEDITERKHRQQNLERYETIMETIDDGVYALDEEGRFTFANEALAALTGHSVSELLGRHVSVIKGEQTVKLGEEVLGRMLSEGIRETTFEFDLEHADGRRIPFEDRMTVLPFEDGEFTGTAGVFRDISAHKRRETMLTSLMETTRELMQAPTKSAVADIVVEATTEILGFDLNAVRFHDPETETLEPVAVTDATREVMGDRPVYAVGEGAPGTVFERGEPAFFADLGLSDDRGDVASSLYLPLGDHGVLSIGSTTADAFDEIDEQVAEILAANAQTALDRAEREQELSRYETIMETVQQMVYVLDDEGRFTLVTTPFAQRLGYDRDQLRGEPAHEFIQSDDRKRFRDAIDTLRSNPDLASQTIETEISTADSDQFPADIEVSLLPGERFTGTVGVVTDRTELENTRERLRDERDRFSYLFNNLPDAVVDTELVGGEPVVQSTNPAFADVFGYDPDIVVGDPISEYVQPDDGRATTWFDAPGTGVTQTEISHQTPDGDRYFLFRSIPYSVGENRTRAFGIYTDITEQKQRQRHLGVLNRVLRHNIRNALTVVLGYAEQLEYELDDPDRLDMVETVTERTQKIVSMSEKVRQSEQIVGRTVTDDAKQVAGTVEAVVADCRSAYPDAEFTVDVPADLAVRADDQLRTAIRNLVENAVEHNDSPTPAVHIEATMAEETVEIRVLDNGPGIPETEQAVIGGDEPITQLTHASGVGLWLVRWIVDAYGGDLSFGDRPAGGAVVSLTLQPA